MKKLYIGDKHFVHIRAPEGKEKGAFIIDIAACIPLPGNTNRLGHWCVSVSFNKARALRDLITEVLGEACPCVVGDCPDCDIDYRVGWDGCGRHDC